MSINFLRKTLLVEEDFDGYVLWKYIKTLREDWTKVFIIKQLRNKEIRVNKKIAVFNYKLKQGDEIEYIDYSPIKKINKKIEQLNLEKLPPLKVVYEDDQIIIVNKEPKVSVQPSHKYLLQNMENRLLNHLSVDLKAHSWRPKFVHRLDHNTCGLLIGAKTYQMHAKLSDDLKNRKIQKWYKCLVFGHFPHPQTTINNWIYQSGDLMMISKEKKNFGKQAISEVKLIKKFSKTSLLEIKLITGRKHQIRAQLSNYGFPVCGDRKYGKNTKENKQFPFTALCAYKLEFLSEDPQLKKVKEKELLIEDIWFEKTKFLI